MALRPGGGGVADDVTIWWLPLFINPLFLDLDMQHMDEKKAQFPDMPYDQALQREHS